MVCRRIATDRPCPPLSWADLPLTEGILLPIDDLGEHRCSRSRLMDVDGIPCLCYNMRANLRENDSAGGAIMEFTREVLCDETKKVLSEINDGEFPEAYEYLDRILNDDDIFEKTPFEIATVLVKCDNPKLFPPFLIDYITALYEYEISEGNADAMCELGGYYYDGSRGFDQSFAKAVQLYKMSADRGNRYAYECLGYCYYYGRDMEPDYEKAFRCFALGAFAGRLESMYKIGDMYLRGQYVDRDEQEAFIIYNRCLQMMTDDDRDYISGPVHLRLGDMYMEGVGTNTDPEAALFHYNLAEFMLYRMVSNGNYMYKKSWRLAIDGQAKARAALSHRIPPDEWVDEPI